MIIDLTKSKLERKIERNVNIMDIQRQLEQAANDPNLTMVTPMWFASIHTPKTWKICTSGSTMDLANKRAAKQ